MVNWKQKSLCKLVFFAVAAISALGLYTSFSRNVPEPLDLPPIEYLHEENARKPAQQPKSIIPPSVQSSSNSHKIPSRNVQFISERQQRCDALKGAYNKKKVEEEMNHWKTLGSPPPNPLVTLKNYKDSQAVKELDKLLNRLKFDYEGYNQHNFLMLLAATEVYADQVLNWLCVLRRNVPDLLPQVLLLSLDRQLHSRLVSMGVLSVYVDPRELLNSTILNCSSSRFASVWMLRTLVVHHIIHFGMDVVVIDTDAMVMKDPTYLYTVISTVGKADVIFGMGKYPFDLGAAWGFTGCMGTSFFKSTPGTKYLLSQMSLIDPFVTDDQVRLNYALNQSGVQWPAARGQGPLGCTIGQTPDKSLRVGLLPETLVCRVRCRRSFHTPNVVDMDAVYIAHPLMVKGDKREPLQLMNLWYLNDGEGGGSERHGDSDHSKPLTNLEIKLSSICR